MKIIHDAAIFKLNSFDIDYKNQEITINEKGYFFENFDEISIVKIYLNIALLHKEDMVFLPPIDDYESVSFDDNRIHYKLMGRMASNKVIDFSIFNKLNNLTTLYHYDHRLDLFNDFILKKKLVNIPKAIRIELDAIPIDELDLIRKEIASFMMEVKLSKEGV